MRFEGVLVHVKPNSNLETGALESFVKVYKNSSNHGILPQPVYCGKDQPVYCGNPNRFIAGPTGLLGGSDY